jgi:uncharacterized protein YdaU (DUF1376 family)
MQYYRRNIGDYYKKAGRLSILQHGVYNLLIDACYDREKFPTRDDAIDWVWASSPDEVEAVDLVLSKLFSEQGDGTFVQKRISEELQEYRGQCMTNSENGKKGGRPKGSKNKAKETEEVNKKTHSVSEESEAKPSESEINPKPLTTNHITTNPKDINADEIFEHWVWTMGKSASTKFTPKRKKNVNARLKEGYTPDQIKKGVDNCRADSWHMGANDNHTAYNDLELICRTPEKLEFFIDKSLSAISMGLHVPGSTKTRDRSLQDDLTDTAWAH